MVFFSCQKCGESLQKPRVEKHYNTKCRQPVSVSCMDCFKDFHGDEYVQHTKCITEEERYSAKGFQMKPNAFKGLQKQEKWIETIQTILKENPKIPIEQKNILNKLVNFENVPRKKVKFQNFMKSTQPRAHPKAVEQVFDLLDKEYKKTSQPNQENGQTPQKATENGTNNGTVVQNGVNKTPTSKETKHTNISNGVNKSKKNDEERFKWKPTILHFVQKKQTIKKKKLMDKVLTAYKAFHPELQEVPTEIVQKYHMKLGKMKKVFVENELVKLKQ